MPRLVTSAVSPDAAIGKPPLTGPRRSGGGVGATIRDNGIQTDKEIQNPVSEPKIAAHTPILFAV